MRDAPRRLLLSEGDSGVAEADDHRPRHKLRATCLARTVAQRTCERAFAVAGDETADPGPSRPSQHFIAARGGRQVVVVRQQRGSFLIVDSFGAGLELL